MILLVEDDADDVFLLERAMQKAKLTQPMHRAANGQEALQYLQASGKYSDRATYPIPSLILLDLKMPLMNGFEVLEWLKEQPLLNRIPVMVLTSSLEESDRRKAEALGAKGFFVKPPTPEKLAQIVKPIPASSNRS